MDKSQVNSVLSGTQTKVDNIKIKATQFVTRHPGKLRDYYRIGKLLGAGHFGEVRLCVNRKNHSQKAVKIINKG